MCTVRRKIKTIAMSMGCWETAHKSRTFAEWMSSLCFLGAEDLILIVGDPELARRYLCERWVDGL